MKKQLFVIFSALLATSAMAQSAFEGFYGQISTGYESNQASNLNSTLEHIDPSYQGFVIAGSNQNFGGVPLVAGLGYNFSVTSNWLLGIGVDYSALNQKSSTFSQQYQSALFSGNQLTISNRFNIFLAPGYALDKDKLVYVKAGYSSVSLKEAFPNLYTSGGSGSLPYASQTQTLSGYIIGLGYKQMIRDGFYGFAEANYMGYSQKTFSSYYDGFNFGPNPSYLSNSPNLSSYQALVGIGYKF
jgi:opacity protein-like surface antigen